ncbi:MAG: glycogen/starch synthase [Bacteroidaceae bacterium]|nr:glycogen/starch synthase [Bacteroidaceae bacterium]
MKTKKVLFITQEINPYIDESELSNLGRRVPQFLQEKGREIRTFMPKWGTINERRSQLHEVIRLSGMNLIIDGTDHLLILKVASIPSARMQVYFIDNDDYFQKRLEAFDENGKEYEDNGERSIFYARGVLETVKKLRWVPDIIHCQGWVSTIAPLFIKTCYREEPSFRDSRIIFTPTGNDLKLLTTDQFRVNIQFKNMQGDELKGFPQNLSIRDLYHLAMDYSEGLLLTPGFDDPELRAYAEKQGKPVLGPIDIADRTNGQQIVDFFDAVWSEGKEEEPIKDY